MWWGDERWLPDGDAERNDKQARDELLASVAVDPARVHPFPAADGRYAGDPEAAASAYAAELAKATRPEDHGPVPRFDVLMLGVGEEGHVASIFPESPAAYETRPVVAVRGSPKPPPTRLTLTFPAIAAATDVWLMAAGAEKAGAIALALGGAGAIQVPAAGVHGRARTLWLLDREAAAKLPPSVLRLPIG
jgi:6-phosphogluconolactonase